MTELWRSKEQDAELALLDQLEKERPPEEKMRDAVEDISTWRTFSSRQSSTWPNGAGRIGGGRKRQRRTVRRHSRTAGTVQGAT